MSVTSGTRSAAYTGNGTTHTFAIGFPYMSLDDVVVAIDGAIQTINSNYEVVGTYPSQSVHFIYFPLGVKTDLPPNVDALITFERETPIRQPTSFRTQGQFLPAVHENSMDRTIMAVQDMAAGMAVLDQTIQQLQIYQEAYVPTIMTETEVLALTASATALPNTAGRLSCEIQNNGPNAIKVGPLSGTTIRVLQPKESWTVDYAGPLYVKALTADQVTGAATVVTELK